MAYGDSALSFGRVAPGYQAAEVYAALPAHGAARLTHRISVSTVVTVMDAVDREHPWRSRSTWPESAPMSAKGTRMSTDAAKAVVRRNTEEVQSRGNFDVFEELFAVDFVDHTPQPNCTPDRDGARSLYRTLRAAFPDFHADIH